MKTKKAQVTVFMILGLIILTTMIMFIYLEKEVSTDNTDDLIQTEKVSQEMTPVKRFVEDCLYQVGEESIKEIGEHGGYQNLDDIGFDLLPGNPTASDALELSENSGYYIPYWFYVTSPNKCHRCMVGSKEPLLHASSYSTFDLSVEANLARTIEPKMEGCLDNFRSFDPKFHITPVGNMTIRPIIKENSVQLRMHYPIEVSVGDKTATISSYIAKDLDLDFKDIYELAEEIVNFEKEHKFLARNTLNTIAAGSMPAPRQDRLPPIAATDLDCGPSVSWYKSRVEEQLKDLLVSSVSRMQVWESKNFAPIKVEDEFAGPFYAQYYMLLNRTNIPFEVTFDYLDWPIYLDIYPSKGELLEGTDLSQNMPLFAWCMHDYQFMYDLSYPIMVSIHDDTAFNGEGYTFRFALEANVRLNGALNYSNETVLPEHDFSLIPGLLQNENQRTSGNYTFTIKDSYTLAPLPDATLTICIPGEDGYCDADSITIGATDAQGQVTTRLPGSMVGLLTVQKQDYHREFLSMGKPSVENTDVEIDMNRIVPKTVRIEKKLFATSIEYFNLGPIENIPNRVWKFYPDDTFPLEDTDTATLTLNRVNDGEEPYSTVAVFDENGTGEVRLLPGTYAVESLVLSSKPIHIPRRKKCIEFPWYTFKADECYWLEAIDMDAVPSGGIKIDKENGLFTVTPDELYADNELVFYAVTVKTEDMYLHEDLEHLSAYEDVFKTNRNDLEPEFLTVEE